MLSKIMAMTRDERIDFTEDDIAVLLNAFVWAGSDTTGSSLAMVKLQRPYPFLLPLGTNFHQIMYFIISHPQTHSRLLYELHSHFDTPEEVTNATASKLPYLTACVNKGLRLHFTLSVGIPRCIPPQSATICNHFFPGNKGLKVLANMQVMQSAIEIFGDDARDFRPERWLDSDEEKLARMQKYFHPCGIGVRVCQGRFIAFMEMYKFAAEMVMKWDFELVQDEKEGGGMIRVNRGYLQQPEGVMVRVKRREEKN
jgi:cytochrome P450